MWWTVFDSSRIMAVKQGDLQKLVVPQSLRQQIMRENHDVPSVGHGGYAQDLGIGGSAFPLARTQRRCTIIYEDLPHLSGSEV